MTINDTKESGALGVELKGQTLVNLATKTWAMGSTAQFNKDTITLTTNTDKAWFSTTLKTVGMKAGGTYLLYTDSITYDASLSSSSNLVSLVSLYEMKPNRNVGKFISNGAVKVTIPSDVDASDIGIRIHATLDEGTGGVGKTTTVKGLMIFEYQEGMENWNIPYFEGMTSCKMPILKSVNQMFDYSLATKPSGSGTVSFTNNGRSLKVNFEVTRDCVNVTNITLPAGTYEISYEIRGVVTLPDGASLSSSRAGLSMFKSSQNWYKAAESLHVSFANMNPTSYTKAKKTITFDESVTVAVVYHGWNNNPVGWCEIKDIRIVPQGKTSILSLPEEVVLRSLPNGVCDTFNTRTGVYTQRIKEVSTNDVIDYTTWGEASGLNTTNNIAFYYAENSIKAVSGGGDGLGVIISDSLSYTNQNSLLQDVEGVASSNNNIIFKISKSKLPSSLTLNNFKAWLQVNPITIQYELKTPIITKINLPSTLKSWNTTTHIYSEIPENTLYPILSHSNPTYPVILKPSTKYSIVANSYSNSHTNSAINFNLGGATASTTVGNRVTTITTPSTLTSEELVMSGRGNKLNNVMVIEGDVVGDEPYFEGICDCKSPILSNCGKNISPINTYETTVWEYAKGYQGFNRILAKNILVNENKAYRLSFTKECEDGLPTHLANIAVQFSSIPLSSQMNDHNSVYTHCQNNKGQKYAHLTMGNIGPGNEYVGKRVTLTNIQLRESSTLATYEPYKSNTTTFDQKDDKTIVLRSLPSGVCDTLNVETGEYVQRIGEVVLDGSQRLSRFGSVGGYYYAFNLPIKPYVQGGRAISDKLLTEESEVWGKTYRVNPANSLAMLCFSLDGYMSVEEVDVHLQQNPIVVQYELATPITTTIDLQGSPYAYKDGHIQLTSGSIEQSLTPIIEYSVPTNRNGQIRSNQKMVEKHQKELDKLQAIILANLVNSQYQQTLTTLNYELSRV